MTEDARLRLLVVDDEQSIRRLCATVGQNLGFVCGEAETAEAALETLEANPADIVITDLKLPNLSGSDLLRKVKEILPRAEVAIMTGHGSIESAVDAMRLGAYDYIEKPFRVERLRQLLQRMAEKVHLVTENQFLRERVHSETNLDGIVGTSGKIQDVLRMISRLKDTRTPVLISGESGTGKELVARAMHFRGPLAEMPFVAVDCGSLVPTLMESELFGHEKGAFTGAVKTKAGLFQAADGGTIFLDEIGELPLELQAKLLRVLQEKEVRPVGSNTKTPVSVRVIVATNRDLESAYRAGTFRKDLYFRLNVVTVHLPSLRERRSDIPQLVHCFLDRYAPGENVQVSPAAMKTFLNYDWPGNVRELENVVERAVVLSTQERVDVDLLPESIRSKEIVRGVRLQLSEFMPPLPGEPGSRSAADNPQPSLFQIMDEIERRIIMDMLERTGWNQTEAAERFLIPLSTLNQKIKRLGIDVRRRGRGDDSLTAATGK
jgi:two-component system response regulator AtoC